MFECGHLIRIDGGARRPPVTLVAIERAADTRGATPRAPTTVAERVAGRAPTVKRSKPKATPRATPPARIETAARALGTPARIADAARIMVGARRPPVTLVA